MTDLLYKQETPRTAKITRVTATPRGIRLIAAFKLFKGLVLLAVGIGAVKLLHKDIAFELERWADMFRVDPNNHYIHLLLERLSILDARKLRELSVGTFFYSALLLTEGTGLLLGQRWAEYFTIIATSSFIPLEVYEIVKRVRAAKVVVLLLNIIVVAYLVIVLRRNHKNTWAEAASQLPNGVICELDKFYYDATKIFNPYALAALLKLVPIPHVLFGTDYPFAIAWTIVKGLREYGVSATDLRAIELDNAVALFSRYKNVWVPLASTGLDLSGSMGPARTS